MSSVLNPRTPNGTTMSTRVSWRFLLGQFVIIVVGVLMALWVDQLREVRANAKLEVEYLESLVVDLEADLTQFDTTEAWMRRQEAAAATVLALYHGAQTTDNVDELVAAVESAGWQYVPIVTRNTIDDLRSTGNLRLIRDPALRRAIAAYYTTVDVVSVAIAVMRDRIWDQYDGRVAHVLGPHERLRVLQLGLGGFGQGTISDAIEVAEAPPELDELVAALRAFPELEIAAGDVLVQSAHNRAGVAELRSAALELRGVLVQRLGSRD